MSTDNLYRVDVDDYDEAKSILESSSVEHGGGWQNPPGDGNPSYNAQKAIATLYRGDGGGYVEFKKADGSNGAADEMIQEWTKLLD